MEVASLIETERFMAGFKKILSTRVKDTIIDPSTNLESICLLKGGPELDREYN